MQITFNKTEHIVEQVANSLDYRNLRLKSCISREKIQQCPNYTMGKDRLFLHLFITIIQFCLERTSGCSKVLCLDPQSLRAIFAELELLCHCRALFLLRAWTLHYPFCIYKIPVGPFCQPVQDPLNSQPCQLFSQNCRHLKT